jgi:hypothetical protein
MNSPLASRSIVAVSPNGDRLTVVLTIGQPYQVTQEEWAIPVSMTGLHDGLRDIHGIDAWQVIQLAYRFIIQLLGYFVEDGGKLYWAETEEPLVLQDLVESFNLRK